MVSHNAKHFFAIVKSHLTTIHKELFLTTKVGNL